MPTSVPLESQEARTLVAWMSVMNLKFHHSPNETGHSMEARRRAVRVKREGTSAGFPDYVVVIPPERSRTGVGCILFVELKRVKGSAVSAEQKAWIAALEAVSGDTIAAKVCKGAQDAIWFVSRYLKPGNGGGVAF